MGASQSTAAVDSTQPVVTQAVQTPVAGQATAQPSEESCPLGYTSSTPAAAPPAESGGQCPMGFDSGANAASSGPVYDVYSREVNPTNMMPSLAQRPAPGQKDPLPTDRVKSSIPKGGTESETWLYPSPQQFYNALVRKNKVDDVTESDIPTVVAIHNAMNERAWGMLKEWEKRYHGAELKEGCPKLRRFMGRPFEPSPKARVKSFLGIGDPFDRHDWFIDRGDGKEVRYILDYYYDAKKEGAEGNVQGLQCIHVDVRPAVDSVDAAWDRVKAFPGRAWDALLNFRTFVDGTQPGAVPGTVTAALGGGGGGASAQTRAADANARLAALDAKCNPLRVRLQEATTDESRHSAYIAFTYCMGTIVCPAEASKFRDVMEQEGGADEAALFDSMQACVAKGIQADLDSARQ
jgi:cytochrome c heme-lyase